MDSWNFAANAAGSSLCSVSSEYHEKKQNNDTLMNSLCQLNMGEYDGAIINISSTTIFVIIVLVLFVFVIIIIGKALVLQDDTRIGG